MRTIHWSMLLFVSAWAFGGCVATSREDTGPSNGCRAATGAGRVSATMIAAAGPMLFAYLFFFQPDYVNGLLVDPIGRALLIVAVFLEVAGLAWVIRLLRSE